MARGKVDSSISDESARLGDLVTPPAPALAAALAEVADLPRRQPHRFWISGACGVFPALALFVGLMTQWSGNLFLRTFSSNFYDVQAHSFLHGRITMPKSVLSVESFTVHGRTSMYFGPFLAVLRMPLMAVAPSLAGRTTQVSMVLAFVVLMVASLSLFGAVWDLAGGATWPRRPMVPSGWALLCGGGSVALYLGGYPSVYSETELWGAALALVTLRCGLAVLRAPTLMKVTGCGLATAATVETRSAIGLGSLALLGALSVVLWCSASTSWPRSLLPVSTPTEHGADRRRLGAVTGIWVVGIVALSILVNEAKFGTPFSVPVRSQGVATDGLSPAYTAFVQHHSSFTELAALPSTILWYFQPFALHLSTLFPFVNFPASVHVLNPAAFEGLNPSSSIPSSMPLLFVLATIGCVLVLSRRPRGGQVGGLFRSRAAVLMVASGVSMVGMLTYPGIAHRHLGDALPFLITAGALGGVMVHRMLQTSSTVLRAVLAGSGVFVLGASVWINAGLGVLNQQVVASYQAGTRSPVAFEQFRHRLHHTMVGGPEPEMSVGAHPPAGPLVGALWADAACGLLEEWTGTRWTIIERGRIGGTVAFRGSLVAMPKDAFAVLLWGQRPSGVPFLVGVQGLSNGRMRPEIVLLRRGKPVIVAHGRTLEASGTHRYTATLAGSSTQESFPLASLAVDGRVVVRSFAIPRRLDHARSGSVPPSAPVGIVSAASLTTLAQLPSATTTPLCAAIVGEWSHR